jgi:chemotaxis protein MotA
MHFIIGLAVVIGTFIISLDYADDQFSGFYNTYSLILLAGMPIGLAIMSYRFSMLGSALLGLKRAITERPQKQRAENNRLILEFGRLVRQDKNSEALQLLDRSQDPILKALGKQVVQQSNADDIEADALFMGKQDLADFKNGEKVFASLGDFAPAMGMVGTVIGLIQLLANLKDFEKLGPGMAIALLTTFYGLLLAHGLYLPIARMIAETGALRADNLNLTIECMTKLAKRRPIHEIQQLTEFKA